MGKRTICPLTCPMINSQGFLRKRLDAGIAGDGVPAPENAGNGVQFEHPKREVTTRARGLGAQSRQTARDGAVGSFCFCAVTDGIAIPSTHIEYMGKDTAAHPAMGSPGCVRQSAKAGETGGGEQYGSQNRPQTGERTSCQTHGARSKENTGTEGENWLEQYTCLVLTGKITACRKVRTLCAVLLDKLRHPEKYRPWVFDEALANHHIEFVERFCKQPQGKLGAPLRLELFQKARWQAIFGFVDAHTGLRQYQECMIVEGRKNGKTTECAGIEIDLLVNDGEGAPEIYSIATKREQAAKSFNACVNMRKQSPELAAAIRKRQSDLYYPYNLGFITALASATNTLDGLNAHGVLVDELAAIKNRAIYDDMKQSMSAREQPLLFSISTNGFCAREHFSMRSTSTRPV